MDQSLVENSDCQTVMRLILKLWLSEGFDTSLAFLCADGCSMIDRRMGIYGYPIEIQALFFMALRCALALLEDSDGDFLNEISTRIKALSYHLHSYYWHSFRSLYAIYRYKMKFNVIPESIHHWVFDLMPRSGCHFIGNVSSARMDFGWFLGNLTGIMSSLEDAEQVEDLVDWQLVTGYEPENSQWSYHDGALWADGTAVFQIGTRLSSLAAELMLLNIQLTTGSDYLTLALPYLERLGNILGDGPLGVFVQSSVAFLQYICQIMGYTSTALTIASRACYTIGFRLQECHPSAQRGGQQRASIVDIVIVRNVQDANAVIDEWRLTRQIVIADVDADLGREEARSIYKTFVQAKAHDLIRESHTLLAKAQDIEESDWQLVWQITLSMFVACDEGCAKLV